MKIDTKKLKLAEVRYFDKEHNGVEVFGPRAYAILYEVDDKDIPTFKGTKYVNIFGLEDFDLVFKRSRFYSCCDTYGFDYGTKMEHVFGEIESGPCLVLTDDDFSDVYGSYVSYEALENYVLRSDHYFLGRENVARERLLAMRGPVKMRKLLEKDKKSAAIVKEFFNERGMRKVKKG